MPGAGAFDNKQATLGIFSDQSYISIGDPYEDTYLRKMLTTRLERPGQHGNRGRGGPTGNQSGLATAAALANRSRPAADGTLPHGRYKLPVLKTAPPLPGTKTWVAQGPYGRTKGPKKGTQSQNCYLTPPAEWVRDEYSRKWDMAWEAHQAHEAKVLYGNMKPTGGTKTMRHWCTKVTRQGGTGPLVSSATADFWQGTPSNSARS